MSDLTNHAHGTVASYLAGCRCGRCLNADLLVPEVQQRLRVSEWTARRLLNAPGGIPAAKVGNKWHILADDIEAYLDKRTNRRRRRRRAS